MVFENNEKKKRAAELALADKELIFQNREKEDRAAELVIANIELTFQNKEKEKRAEELIIANEELLYQNKEKGKRADELIIANEELSFQNEEKEKRATELKETISLLNDSEIFNRGILNSLSSNIAVMDGLGNVIAVNESWDKFSVKNGATALQSTGVGSNYFKVCTTAVNNGDPLAGEIMKGIKEVVNGTKRIFYIEYPCHSPEEQRWYGMRAIKFEGAGDLVVVSHINITERRLAEQNLSISEASLKEAQSIAHMGNYDLDLVNETSVWSDELYSILGLNKELTVPSSETFMSFIHPDDVLNFKESLAASFKTMEISGREFRFIKSGGSIRYGRTESQFEVDDQNKPVRLFGIFQDVTEQKLADIEKTTMVNDLVTRNKDLEQFAYIVSHNFRSPIANILGASEALRDEDLTAEDITTLTQGINTSVLKLDGVVKDLNFILEVNSGINDQKEMVNLPKMVNDIIYSIRNLIDKHNITITHDFSEVDEIFSLRPYLHSICYNLITNSIKYRRMDIPGIISVKSKKIGDTIELVFTDNGMGIDMLTKGNDVFVMYKRFHQQIEGKGMGLFMVKTQVEALNGRITLKSGVNEGCIFSIVFSK